MATLVRRLFKIVLFIGLLLLSVRYVHPYPYEWTETQMRAWLYTSQALGIRDPEDLYFAVWVTIELIVALGTYIAIVRLWRHCQRLRSRA
ncbi:conserved hypothetical protein [Paraburkholderia sacchari]|uniref:hypothetical protein n=1 Tax=Paraburkholderia sacchari TaxID=159450 RepID=UPI0039A763E0